MKKHYINAIVELLLKGNDVTVVLTNLQKVLTAKGHQKIHAQILTGVVQKLEMQQKHKSSTIAVAKSEDVATLQAQISATLAKLGGTTDKANIVIDPSLIGGYVALHNGKSIDASYKQKLVTLYRAITK